MEKNDDLVSTRLQKLLALHTTHAPNILRLYHYLREFYFFHFNFYFTITYVYIYNFVVLVNKFFNNWRRMCIAQLNAREWWIYLCTYEVYNYQNKMHVLYIYSTLIETDFSSYLYVFKSSKLNLILALCTYYPKNNIFVQERMHITHLLAFLIRTKISYLLIYFIFVINSY